MSSSAKRYPSCRARSAIAARCVSTTCAGCSGPTPTGVGSDDLEVSDPPEDEFRVWVLARWAGPGRALDAAVICAPVPAMFPKPYFPGGRMRARVVERGLRSAFSSPPVRGRCRKGLCANLPLSGHALCAPLWLPAA